MINKEAMCRIPKQCINEIYKKNMIEINTTTLNARKAKNITFEGSEDHNIEIGTYKFTLRCVNKRKF